MSGGNNTPGISKFAGVLKEIAAGAQDNTPVLDFGEIQADYSLLCNTYEIPIPKSDYLICRGLTYSDSESNTTSYTTAGGDSHRHTVSVVRDKDKHVKVGDRVLVAWVGNDAVVVDVITAADDLF